jgi:hypothetical protein
MKIKDGFVLKSVGDNHVVVPVGAAQVDFRSMIALNGSGAFLWTRLQQGSSEQELVQALLAEYDVDAELAQRDAALFVQNLREQDLLED